MVVVFGLLVSACSREENIPATTARDMRVLPAKDKGTDNQSIGLPGTTQHPVPMPPAYHPEQETLHWTDSVTAIVAYAIPRAGTMAS